MSVPGSDGTGRAWVDGTAPSLPVTVDSTHNQFKFNSVEYYVPSGVYATIKALADAVNAATANDGDSHRFDTVVTASESPASGLPATVLRFTNVASGVHTETFATGTTHSVLSRLVVSNGTALANGFVAGTPTTYSADLTDDQVPPADAEGVSGNPVVVAAVVAGDGIDVDDTDPSAPVVSIT